MRGNAFLGTCCVFKGFLAHLTMANKGHPWVFTSLKFLSRFAASRLGRDFQTQQAEASGIFCSESRVEVQRIKLLTTMFNMSRTNYFLSNPDLPMPLPSL